MAKEWLDYNQLQVVTLKSTVKVCNAFKAIQLIQLSEKQNEQFKPIIITSKTKVNE